MDTLDALLERNSAAKICAPAPTGPARQALFKAALRAPDHARLKPWRFLVVEGDGRQRLGELFAQVALAEQPSLDEQALAAIQAKPLRAPLIVVVVVRLRQHPKVPQIEQYLSAGAGAHAMLLAAHAQGFAGIWRTGPMAFSDSAMAGLGLSKDERIVGFLYLGTRVGSAKPLPDYPVDDFFSSWPQ